MVFYKTWFDKRWIQSVFCWGPPTPSKKADSIEREKEDSQKSNKILPKNFFMHLDNISASQLQLNSEG